MSFWPFGQHANSASNLKKLLGVYYEKRATEFTNQQQQQQETGTHGAASSQHPPPYPGTNSEAPEGTSGNESIDKLDQDESSDIILNKEFLWSILDDPSLLNELKQQNNKLIDFICFGYLNDETKLSKRDTDGDVEVENEDKSDTTDKIGDEIKDDNSSITIKNVTISPTSQSIMEVLIELIINSFDWFERNEKLLIQATNGFEDDELEEENDEDDFAIELNRIHIASEILSSNIWLISEALVEDQTLLSKLWSILTFDLKHSSPTIPLFVKINERLLESRPDQLLNFIRNQSNLVDLFIKHIDITIIMDLLLRIITTDKPDIPTGIIDTLSEQDLINKLLDILRSDDDSSTQSSCGDFLKAVISLSANTSIDENTIGPNLLIKQLVNDESIEKIIQIILNRGNGLSTVVGVIIEIIRKNNSDYDPINLFYTTLESHPPSKRDPIYLGKMLKKFSDNLGKFDEILFNKENTSKRIKNQINQEIEPLGFERFKICELIAELLHCSNIGLLNNHLTEKIIEERENFLAQQEEYLANALNDELLEEDFHAGKVSSSLNLTNLNIGGTSEPSVAVSSKTISVSPNMDPSKSDETSSLDIDDGFNSIDGINHLSIKTEVSRKESLRINPTVGDEFKIQLIDSKILQHIITMFTKFPWNNFWHNVVFDLVQQIFNGRIDLGYNSFLILALFDTCDITNLIINAHELCTETENEINVRLGYMGHLVLIAEEVVKFSSIFQTQKLNDPEADELIYNTLVDDNWINYVTNVLSETREQYNGVLGGIKTQEFEQSDYLNNNAIILGQTEEEILNQPIDDDTDLQGVFYESKRHQDEQEEEREDIEDEDQDDQDLIVDDNVDDQEEK